MGKFFGKVGYVTQVDDGYGVYDDRVKLVSYYGEVTRNARRWEQSSEQLHDSLVLNNLISIMADDYAYEHFYEIRFVEYMGSFWKVTNIEIQRPRITLTLGGVYNGNTQATSDDTGDDTGV